MQAVLAVEAAFRDAASIDELRYLGVNEIRKLTGARQAFLVTRGASGGFRMAAVSSLSAFDRDAPLVRWMERTVGSVHVGDGKSHSGSETEAVAFNLQRSTRSENDREEAGRYPFAHALWQPLVTPSSGRKQSGGGGGAAPSERAFAGIVLTRETPFLPSDRKLASRLGGTLAHAWAALAGPRLRHRPGFNRKLFALMAAAALAGLGALPVPLTTLAPMEVVARDPFVVAAPIDGVIAELPYAPNTRVERGDIIVRFDDTTLRNKAAIKAREVKVADAVYRKAQQGAFSDKEARFQLPIAAAELALRQAELDFARDLLAKTAVMAPRDGILSYSDKDALEGKPVATGETILELADPALTEIRIELPVEDAIVLREGANVRLFLDTDPLNAVAARITKGSYHAEPTPAGSLAYRLKAEFLQEPEAARHRIGARGTAQVFGETVPLAFFILRRPIAAVRQSVGI